MKHTKTILVLAGAALSVSGLNALADSTTVNKDEVRAIVAEMLADAQSRSSLLQGQGNAGYDKKFYLASPDNNYRLNIGGYLQFRYGLNFGQDDSVNEFQTGFSFRRARLEFGGHVVNPDLKFLISGDFADTQTPAGATAVFGNPFVSTFTDLGNTTPTVFTFNPGAGGIIDPTDPDTVTGGPTDALGIIGGAPIRNAADASNPGSATGQYIDFNNNQTIDPGEFSSGTLVGTTANGAFGIGKTIQFAAPSSYNFQNREFALKDAVIDYTLGGGWYVRGGQYKLPFLKEELVADTHGLSADRSILNDLFTGTRSQGVGIGYRDETFRFMTDYSDGFNAENTPFSNGSGGIVNGAAEYATTTRVEYAFAGNLDDWKQFTSQQDDEFKGYVGAAFHYQGAQNDQDTAVPANGLDLSSLDPQSYVSYTVDAGIKGSGFSLFAAFVGAHTRFLDSVILNQNEYNEFSDFGVNVTGAWRFVNTDEVFARWDGIFYDDDRFTDPNAEDNYHFLTVGWNHYFAGQAARFTVDSVIALTETRNDPTSGFGRQGVESVSRRGGAPFGDNQLLYDTNETGQVGVRFQFQLMF